MTSEVKWQNYINDATDALIQGDTLDPIRDQYAIAYGEDEALITIIEDINALMVEVQPSKQFAKRLQDDLMGAKRTGVVWRIRRLPARVQMAALAAIISGFLLILQRLFLSDNGVRNKRPSALQEEA